MKKNFDFCFRFFIYTLLLAAAGCSRSQPVGDDSVAPNTGMIELEAQTGAMPIANVKTGAYAYISAESVRIRSTPEVREDNIVGRLYINDKIEILEATPIGPQQFVLVRIISTTSPVALNQRYYVSLKYFNTQPVVIDSSATSLTPAQPPHASPNSAVSNRLFVVTNVATEKLRVYQRCTAKEGCLNRMIFEADVVNGQDDNGTRTNVGYYKLTNWHKFYESPASVYPAWYKLGYPPVPAPGDRYGWFQPEAMPNGKGSMRGAFGWYTAHVGPNADGQWTHGTGGWGQDKLDFILFKDSFAGAIASIFTSIRSHGCTRIDNESIAYLRSLLAPGTPVIKIYAQEAYRDSRRAQYTNSPLQWNYILTKVGAQKVDGQHQVADRTAVLAARTPQTEWIEQGTYDVDQFPDAIAGDLYRLGDRAFQGTFLVDEGTVFQYQHPPTIGRGGFSDQIVPIYMLANTPPTETVPVFNAPTVNYR